MGRFASILLVAGALAAGAALVPRGVHRQPNVILVTIDTLRADAVGAHGDTPAIDDFLAQGTRFANTRSTVPLTLPAHVSLFTGLFPPHHAVHDNIDEALPPRAGRPFPLLAEEFKDAGYATAAFVASAVLAAETGLSAGFGTYAAPERVENAEGEVYVPAEDRLLDALAWIDGRKGPYFAWIHLYDPHLPYHPFRGDARRARSHAGDRDLDRYRGEVRRVDAAIERLLAAVPPDTVVVIASDHGESFGEHHEVTHGPLVYGTTLDVFLAIRGPGFRAGVTDDGLRSLCDVAPTLRRTCALDAQPTDGQPLQGPPHGVLVSESLHTHGMHAWAQCFSATDGRHSLVETGSGLGLFDRSEDVRETRALALTLPAYETLDRAMQKYRDLELGDEGGRELLTPLSAYGQVRRRTLQYLQRHENTRLPDVGARVELWYAIAMARSEAKAAWAQRQLARLEACVRQLDDLAEEAPESPALWHFRAEARGAMGDLTRDRWWFGQAARAEIEAIRRGHTRFSAVEAAAAYCIGGDDPEALRELLDAVAKLGLATDQPALRHAAGVLGVDAAPGTRFTLNRAD